MTIREDFDVTLPGTVAAHVVRHLGTMAAEDVPHGARGRLPDGTMVIRRALLGRAIRDGIEGEPFAWCSLRGAVLSDVEVG